MITTFGKSMKGFAVLAIALLCAVAFAPAASAQTYYYPAYPTYQYQSYSTHTASPAQIQTLLNQVYALLAQLQALQGGGNYTYTHTTKPTSIKYTTGYDHEDYDIEVDTEDVDVNDDEATFTGSIELDDASYAHVWFQYGTDGDLDEETDDMKVTDDEDFEMDVDDLDEGDRYYVRAVAQDPSGYVTYGDILAFTAGNDDDDDEDEDDDDDDNNDDIPEAITEDADDVDENGAEIRGEIEMNDFEDGLAFFVYGQDEDAIEDVEEEDSYSDVDSDGDDIQKFVLSSNLDDTRTFWSTISGLDEDTDYFFRICVEYEDEDGDDTLQCGDVESFTTEEN
jgi:hypothetical protein